MLKNVVLCFALSSAIALSAFAERPSMGGATSGGGDVMLIKKVQLARLLNETRMKNRLREYLMRLEILGLDPSEATINANLKKILPNLTKDIKQSPYTFGGPCVDEDGNAKSASTLNNVPGAPICFDPAQIEKLEVSEAVLVGLTLHEHARHLGVPDEDHQLANFVVSDYELTKQTRAPQERGLSLDNKAQELVAIVLCSMNLFHHGNSCPRFLEWNEAFRTPDHYPWGFSELKWADIRTLLYVLETAAGPNPQRVDPKNPISLQPLYDAVFGPRAGFMQIVKVFQSTFKLPELEK